MVSNIYFEERLNGTYSHKKYIDVEKQKKERKKERKKQSYTSNKKNRSAQRSNSIIKAGFIGI